MIAPLESCKGISVLLPYLSPYSLFHAPIRTNNWTGENLSFNRLCFF